MESFLNEMDLAYKVSCPHGWMAQNLLLSVKKHMGKHGYVDIFHWYTSGTLFFGARNWTRDGSMTSMEVGKLERAITYVAEEDAAERADRVREFGEAWKNKMIAEG